MIPIKGPRPGSTPMIRPRKQPAAVSSTASAVKNSAAPEVSVSKITGAAAQKPMPKRPTGRMMFIQYSNTKDIASEVATASRIASHSRRVPRR
jgi:hypothetical protein